MVSIRVLAYSLLSYVIVAFWFNVTGWKSLFLNILVMCLLSCVFNPKSRLKLTIGFTMEKKKYTNGGDNDDDHANLHRGAAGTPEHAD